MCTTIDTGLQSFLYTHCSIPIVYMVSTPLAPRPMLLFPLPLNILAPITPLYTPLPTIALPTTSL